MQLKAVALAAAAVMLTACSSNAEKGAPPSAAIPVLAVAPEVKDVPVHVESVGVLRASVAADIRPQVGGTITDILVTEGDWVQPGTPLLKIDPSSYEIKLQEARAKLEMDRAAHNAAVRKLERFRSLADKDLISKAEWDEMETAAEKSAAALEADMASVRAAEIDLGYCQLTACVEGRVGRLDLHRGQLISKGQEPPVATIAKMDPLLVEFTLTEREASLLPRGEVPLELLAIQGGASLGLGKITFVDNHYDVKTGLLLIRGSVPNGDMRLRPGQSVRVRVPVSVLGSAKLIPQKAVKYNQDGPYLYVVNESDTVEMRKIALGKTQGNQVIVSEGLPDGVKVITDGHMRIYPGAKVEVKE